MAASDNTAAASADLRRLAAFNEADLQAALSGMGREPFRRLRRAVGRTATPSPSGDEGGSGPSGAVASSSPYHLDPAANVTNQVTAPSEANLNNLDPASNTYSFVAAVASMATQDPLWPPSLGGVTALDAGGTISPSAPTAGSTSMPATAPTTLATDDAREGRRCSVRGAAHSGRDPLQGE